MANLAIWGISLLATAGVILRAFNLPEAVWAAAGALALVCLGLLPLGSALQGVEKGLDVYLFLIGMMLLAEIARNTGLFNWLAAQAAAHARGSARRLFDLVYLVGILVTVFLSNDATAVVLTPAVAAVSRSANLSKPLPYLLICAFIANAASFVLPISNPANLVIYADHMPPLAKWLPLFALPSVAAIAVTYLILRRTQRAALSESLTVSIIEVTSGGGIPGAIRRASCRTAPASGPAGPWIRTTALYEVSLPLFCVMEKYAAAGGAERMSSYFASPTTPTT